VTRIVLLDGELRVRQSFQECLNREGFAVEVLADASEARERFKQAMPALVMLDAELGGNRETGFQFCQELRPRAPALPIVFLTNRYRQADHITSLRLGADDYLAKNVSRDFLAVRLRALLRRVEALRGSLAPLPSSNRDSLMLNRTLMLGSWKEAELKLNITQYWLLDALTAEPGRLKTYTELLQASQQTVEPNTISAQIMRIREAFRKVDPDFDLIRTERGHGYRWVG
jgi:two-component system, OmpR family, response regulator